MREEATQAFRETVGLGGQWGGGGIQIPRGSVGLGEGKGGL